MAAWRFFAHACICACLFSVCINEGWRCFYVGVVIANIIEGETIKKLEKSVYSKEWTLTPRKSSLKPRTNEHTRLLFACCCQHKHTEERWSTVRIRSDPWPGSTGWCLACPRPTAMPSCEHTVSARACEVVCASFLVCRGSARGKTKKKWKDTGGGGEENKMKDGEKNQKRSSSKEGEEDERTDVKICFLFVSGRSLSRPRALLQRSQRGDLKAYPVRETVSPRSRARKKKHRETASALGNRSPPFPLKWTARNIKKKKTHTR